MSAPVVAIVGYSDTGKTTIAVSLVRLLSQRGYRIVAVKHAHEGHDLGPARKDTSKLFAAGASKVIASSPGQLTATERVAGDTSLEEIVATLKDGYDLVIAEGFKGSSVPKVLVTRRGFPLPAVDSVIAVVGEAPEGGALPVFNPRRIEALADFLVTRLVEGAVNKRR